MRLLLALLSGVGLVFAAAVCIAYSGWIDVAATHEHISGVEWFLRTTQEHSVEARAEHIEVPPLTDPAMIDEGFEHFHSMCVECHGAPGIPPGELGQGLNPAPPALHRGKRDAAEEFWVVKNGIRMTGMPSFGKTHSDHKIWEIVAFLQQLPSLNASAYAARVRQAGLPAHAGAEHEESGEHPHPESSGDAA